MWLDFVSSSTNIQLSASYYSLDYCFYCKGRQVWIIPCDVSTLESVNKVPEEALKSGNKNGPVLMWAAMSASDTVIIKALVSRGAEINEADKIFSGTPLTGAAGYSKYPEILHELVALGTDINKRVNNNETALMIAAQYNENEGIIEELVALGANVNNKNKQGKTALDLAIDNNNTIAEKSLKSLIK